MSEAKLSVPEPSLTQAQGVETPTPVAARNSSDPENANISKRQDHKATNTNEEVRESEQDELKDIDLESIVLDGNGVEVNNPRMKQKRRKKILCFCWEVTWER